MKRITLLLCAAVVAGCAAPSANMRIGSAQSYESLQAQREAVRAVTVATAVPAGAVVTGTVDASRCHRYQGDIPPTPEQVRDDLIAAAYGRGADGIVVLDIVTEAGLQKNCWHIITGRATMYRMAAAK